MASASKGSMVGEESRGGGKIETHETISRSLRIPTLIFGTCSYSTISKEQLSRKVIVARPL